MAMITLVEVLHKRLVEAGIPITGVVQQDATTFAARYAPEATAQQISDGDAIVAAFDAVAEQAILDAKEQLPIQAKEDFRNLPNWATWTGQEAADALKAAILAGMTKTEARAAIDAQFAGINTLAQLGAATVAILKQLSDAVIDGRDVGHQNEARAIMYLRDIVVD